MQFLCAAIRHVKQRFIGRQDNAVRFLQIADDQLDIAGRVHPVNARHRLGRIRRLAEIRIGKVNPP
jgi:hypothetical protein